jgi:hypothetical protein
LNFKEHGAERDPAEAAMMALILAEADAGGDGGGSICAVKPDPGCPSTISRDPKVLALEEQFRETLPLITDQERRAGACWSWHQAATMCLPSGW